jgi:hypothetical protein
MGDISDELVADHRPYREFILSELRTVARQYIWLTAIANGATRDTLRRLASKIGGEPVGPMSNARAWRLTVDIIMKSTDRHVRVLNASKAVFARIGAGMRWTDVAEELHRPVDSTKDIVDQAAARLFAEFVTRGITDDYRGDIIN